MKTLAIIMVAMLMASCIYDDGIPGVCHTYVIRQGDHRDITEPLLPLVNNELSGTVWIDPSMVAGVGFVSKIVGISSVCNYQNSARLGWRTVGDRVELVTYVYHDGETPQQNPELKKSILVVTPPARVEFRIKFENDGWTFYVDSIRVSTPGTWPHLRYITQPWYGGESSAPHDIFIKINYKTEII